MFVVSLRPRSFHSSCDCVCMFLCVTKSLIPVTDFRFSSLNFSPSLLHSRSFCNCYRWRNLCISFSVASNGCAYHSHSTYKMRLCKLQGGHTNKSLYFLFMFLLMTVAFLCVSSLLSPEPCFQLCSNIVQQHIHIGSCVHKMMCSH